MPKSRGFTLVELLVVISIIGILSTIGIVSFTRVQQIARDGKRVADIDSIAKSLETAKDFSTGIYYNKLSTDFPNGIPTDPKGITRYCICYSNTKCTISDAPTSWSTSCYALWQPISDSLTFTSNVKSWKLCAKKESSNTVYCQHSLEKADPGGCTYTCSYTPAPPF